MELKHESMSVINKNTIKSTFIYFVGNVLSKAMMFFMLPLYTNRIPANEMGLYDTNTTVITFFSSVLFLDIGSTILKYSLAGKDDFEKKKAMTHGLLIFSISTLLYLVILSFVGFIFEVDYFIWIVLYGLLYVANTVVGQCARAVEHNMDYAVSGIIQTLVLIATNIILIIGLDFDYSALMISFCVATATSLIYLLLRTSLQKSVVPALLNREYFKDMLKFTLPLCVNSIAFWFLSSSGKVILRYMSGAEQVGYLSIAGKFTQIIYLVSSCVQLTWQEIAYGHDNDRTDTGEFYSKGFSLYVRVMLMGVILIIPCIKIGLSIFPTFIDVSYTESLDLIPCALFGTGLAILSQFLGTIFSSIKKTNIVFVSTLVGAVVSVSTNIAFILLNLGAASVNYSFIMGYAATILMRIFILKKAIDFHLSIRDILIPTILFIIVCVVYSTLTVAWSVLAVVIIVGIFILLLKNEIMDVVNNHSKKEI